MMQLPPEQIARLNRFAADIKAALDTFDAPPDIATRCGLLIGFAWAQLRREFPPDVCRRIIDDTLDGAEKQIAQVGRS
jgi:hypothetical protein